MVPMAAHRSTRANAHSSNDNGRWFAASYPRCRLGTWPRPLQPSASAGARECLPQTGQAAGQKLSGDCAASQAVTAQQATFCGKVAGSMRSSVSFTVWCTSK